MNVTVLILAGVLALIPLLLFLFGSGVSNKDVPEDASVSSLPERKKKDTEDDEFSKEQFEDDEHVELGSDFEIPFKTKQIIPDNSPYEIYQKTLEIAEIQGKNGNLESARELYEGLLDRISSKDIRDKIQENIDYLDNYQLIASTRAREKRQKAKDIEQAHNEIRVSMGGKDILPENIKIDISPAKMENQISLDSAIDKISEKLSLLQPALSDNNAKLNELAAYRQELETLKAELRNIHESKEQAERSREEKVQRELEELQRLRSEIENTNTQRQKTEEIEALKNELERVKQERQNSAFSTQESALLREQLTKVQSELLAQRLRQETEEAEKTLNSSAKEELQHLREQLELAQSHRTEVVNLQQQITKLTEELARASEKENEIDSLKEQIEQMNHRLERPVASEEQLSFMKNEIKTLTQQLVSSETQRIESETVRKELEKLKTELAFNQTNDEFIDTLKTQMQSMQSQLQSNEADRAGIEQLRQELQQMKQGTGASAGASTDTSYLPASGATRGSSSKIDPASAAVDDTAADSNKVRNDRGISEETEEITRIEKTAEDKKEEFETLEDYLNGPQYDLPSDDDILEKILAEELKNKKKNKEDDSEYNVKGPDADKNDQDFNEEFDITKLFEKPDNQKPEDEEFYAKFLEKTRPKVKKELPILDVHYKFEKIPESTVLSKEANVIEESFYKYKGMLDKANDFIKRRKVKDALNYYEVIMSQDIPEEFKKMIKRNIDDLNEYLDKYMLS